MKYRPPPDGNWGTVHPLGCSLRQQGHPPASGSRQARPPALEQNLGRRRGIRRRQCGHQAPPPASPLDATAGRHVFLVKSSRPRAECSVSRASHARHCPVCKAKIASNFCSAWPWRRRTGSWQHMAEARGHRCPGEAVEASRGGTSDEEQDGGASATRARAASREERVGAKSTL